MNALRLLSILLLAPLLLASEEPANRDEYMASMRESLQRFQKVYQYLVFRYVDEINPEATIEAAIHGMLDELDPYTDYFIEDEAESLDEMTRGEYGGLGMQVGQRGSDKRLTIISPFEDSPAWKAGLLPGDIISEIDGVPTGEDKLSSIVSRMKGEPGTPVTITIERPGYETPMVYTLTRELITIQDLKFAGIIDKKEGLGYVRLTGFSGKATESLRDALEDLNAQGMKKLVLDLRGNPGGLLREAVGVADLFLPKGALVVETRGRDDETLKEYFSENDPLFTGDLVVLVNQGSASASEIVSGAIQDLDRGVIVGNTTYGKGLVQSVMSLDANSKVKLTTAKYYIPSGRLIQRIDYFEDNKVLYHTEGLEAPDTLFHTDQGRVVVGGRGIQPDLEQEPEAWPFYVSELWRANLFINFLTDRERNGKPMADTKVNEDLLAEFQTYVQAQDFTFKPSGSEQLEELEEIVKREAYASPVTEALISLRQKLEGDPEQHFAQNKEWIERLLTSEILGRAESQDARTRYTLEYDRQFGAAKALLTEGEEQYRATLRPAATADAPR